MTKFKNRLKTYIILFSLLQILVCAGIMTSNLTLSSFTFFMYLLWTCYGFVDSLGEGMTAMITKMELKIRTLDRENDKEFSEEDEKKAFGNFYMFRFFVRTATSFNGGLLPETLNIRYLYGVLMIAAVLMILVTLVVFREEKVRKNLSKLQKS